MASLRVVERSPLFIRCVVEGVPPSLINSLRRAILAELPVLAVDSVAIVKNTSAMYDEMLAHRIGLVPLKTPLDQLPRIEECEMGLVDPAECTVRLSLQVEASEGPMVVYSGHLSSDHPGVAPVHPDIPIAKLEAGQGIVLEAYARLGRAREHAKWQAALAGYYYYPRVEVLDERCREACRDVCRNLEDPLECSYNRAKTCEEHCRGGVRVEWERNKYVFWAESYGAYDVETAVRTAISILKAKFSAFLEAVRSKAG